MASFTDPIRELKYPGKKKTYSSRHCRERREDIYAYRAQDKIGKPAGTSRIGLAESEMDFISPGNHPRCSIPQRRGKEYEWEGGCEDPRVDSKIAVAERVWLP